MNKKVIMLLVTIFISFALMSKANIDYNKLPDSENPYEFFFEAEDAFLNGQYNESIEFANQGIKYKHNADSSHIPTFYFERSIYFTALNEYEKALSDINNAIHLNEKDEFNRLMKLIIQWKKDRKLTDEERDILDSVESEHSVVNLYKGILLFCLGDYLESEYALKKSISIKSLEENIFFSKYMLANTYFYQKSYIKCKKLLLEIQPDLNTLEQMNYFRKKLSYLSALFLLEPFDEIGYTIDSYLTVEDNFRQKFAKILNFLEQELRR